MLKNGLGRVNNLQLLARKILQNKTAFAFLALGVILLVFGILKPVSVSRGNLQNVFREASLLGLVALGQGIVMLAGGMDISVGNIMFFMIIYGGNLMKSQPDRLLPVTFICLALGALIGLVNGIGVAKLKISPIIMTLGTSSIIYGLIYIFGGAMMASPAPSTLQFIGKRFLLNFIPITSLFWIGLTVLFCVILYRTTYGRAVYAVGNNSKTAWMSGIRSDRVLIIAYVICDSLAALAGLLLLGYLGTPTLRFTDIYTMGSIAAVVIGGIEFFSGRGSIIGVVAGVIIVRFIFNVLVMMNVPEAGRMMIEGGMILAIVALYKVKVS